MTEPTRIPRIAKTILDLMFPISSDPEPSHTTVPAGVESKGARRPAAESDLDGRVRALLAAGSPSVAAGRLQILALDKIRDSLGERWGGMAEKVHTLTSCIIEKRLASVDVYMRHGESNYVIVFGELTKEEAQVKSALIADEIWRELLGEGAPAEKLEVRTAVVSVDGSVLAESVDLNRVVGGALADAAARNDGEPVKRDGPTADKKEPEAGADGETARGHRRFAYWPLWDRRRKALLAYLCVPTHDPRGSMPGAPAVDGSAEKRFVAELDGQVLEQVGRDLRYLSSQGRRLPVVCRVHFETLARPKSRAHYLGLCSATVREELRKYLLFEIVGIPVDVPQVRLSDVVPYLRTFCRTISCQVGLEQENFGKFRSVGVHDVGIDLGAYPYPEARLMKMTDAFARRAHREGFSTFVHGIRSTSLATSLVCAGFDYLSGDAVHPAFPRLEHAYRFQAADLFSHLLH